MLRHITVLHLSVLTFGSKDTLLSDSALPVYMLEMSCKVHCRAGSLSGLFCQQIAHDTTWTDC